MEIIFTDMDGTLLDHDNYSYSAAEGALTLIREKQVPLVVCTSKTAAEIIKFRKEIKNNDPFISENGGAVFIPKGYFNFEFDFKRQVIIDMEEFYVIELGTPYTKLREVIELIRDNEIDVVGFGDMSDDEVAKDTGLSLVNASLSKKREYDEAFILKDESREMDMVHIIRKNGLNHTKGGRYHHVMGDNDKGKAVCILLDFFRRTYGSVYSLGFGDSKNDFPMLDVVDKGYLVKKHDGTYSSDAYNKAEGIGPAGWNEIIKKRLI